MTKNITLEHAVRLQQSLMALENSLDGHLHYEGHWTHVLKESTWLEKNHEFSLGTPLSSCLERINTIEREGGPDQGKIQLITEAIQSITNFVKTLLTKKAA